jgi:hypothetical protein
MEPLIPPGKSHPLGCHGIHLVIAVDGANRHDVKLFEETLKNMEIARPKPTKEHPQGMCLDKGYDSNEIRALVKEFGFTAHIRSRGEEANEIKKSARKKHDDGS